MPEITDPAAEAREAMRDVLDNRQRGPDRVMEVQRARMWDRNPGAWTRYECILAAALERAEQERDEWKSTCEYVTKTLNEVSDTKIKAERALEHEREERLDAITQWERADKEARDLKRALEREKAKVLALETALAQYAPPGIALDVRNLERLAREAAPSSSRVEE